MIKPLHVILFLILSPVLITGQTINWETETGLTAPSAFTDGQVIKNFAGTGLNARINVDIVTSHPIITSADPTAVTIGGARTDCRFTLTFLNGTANIRVNNFENLQSGEIITLSNPDEENITIRQTTNNGGGLMKIDGTSVPVINTSVIEDDTAVIQEVNDGAGTQWWARMNNISSFTWEYDEATGTSAIEGFTLTLLSTALPVELISFSSKTTINNEVVLK